MSMETLTVNDKEVELSTLNFTPNDKERTKFLIVFFNPPRRKRVQVYHLMTLQRINNLNIKDPKRKLISFRLKLAAIYRDTKLYLANKKNGFYSNEEKLSEKWKIQKRIYLLMLDFGIPLSLRYGIKRYIEGLEPHTFK